MTEFHLWTKKVGGFRCPNKITLICHCPTQLI